MRLAGSRTATTLTQVSRGGGVGTTHLFRACSGSAAVTGVWFGALAEEQGLLLLLLLSSVVGVGLLLLLVLLICSEPVVVPPL